MATKSQIVKHKAMQEAFKLVYNAMNDMKTNDKLSPAVKLIELGKAFQQIGQACVGLDLLQVERVINAAAALHDIDNDVM